MPIAARPHFYFSGHHYIMFSIKAIFDPDYERYEGVRPINIYLLRLLFFLVVVFVASDSWSAILKHEGQWDHVKAAAVCMWGRIRFCQFLGWSILSNGFRS
jgi:hypothetical protein